MVMAISHGDQLQWRLEKGDFLNLRWLKMNKVAPWARPQPDGIFEGKGGKPVVTCTKQTTGVVAWERRSHTLKFCFEITLKLF